MNGLKILVLLGFTFGCCVHPKVYVLGTAQDGGSHLAGIHYLLLELID